MQRWQTLSTTPIGEVAHKALGGPPSHYTLIQSTLVQWQLLGDWICLVFELFGGINISLITMFK
jgi:hypothetical protein